VNEFEIFSQNQEEANNIQLFVNEGKSATKHFSIKNNSKKATEFEIFTQSATSNNNQKLSLSNHIKEKQNLASWIKIPTKKITIPANSTKSIPIHIQVPQNANRGDHQAIIIARPTKQTKDQKIELINQKGLQITNTITGPKTAELILLKDEQYQCGDKLCFKYTLQNQGTSSAEFNVNFQIKNNENSPIEFLQNHMTLSRGEATSTKFQWSPPLFGKYSTTTTIDPTTSYAEIPSQPQEHTFSFFPLWSVISSLSLILVISILIKISFKHIRALFKRKKEIQFTSLIILILLSGTIIQQLFFPINFSSTFAQEMANEEQTNSYLTIQWGNVRQIPLPSEEIKKEWNFEISIDQGLLFLDSNLDFENTDRTEEIKEKKSIHITSSTNNDIDGIILFITKNKTKDPIIKFKDNNTKKTVSYHLSDLSNEQILSNNRQSIHILQSDMYYKAKRFFTYSQEKDLNNILEATKDITAFLENPATPQIDIEEIRHIFSLLPATYEAFTELRPNYDLIHKITAASAQATIFADPILITELAASPNFLKELAASPSRNIVFLADRKLVFPKQEFDFKKQRIISIPLNEILVNHKKKGKWKTFVQASDFISQTNNNKIEVTNLCIIPGEIEWLHGQINNFFLSEKHCFKSTEDQFLLLERYVGEPVSFKMRPTLELKIPEETSPSVYQGKLTITEL